MPEAPATVIDKAISSLPHALEDHTSTLSAIEAALQALVDPKYKEGMTRTVPGASGVYGVRVPNLRALAKPLAAHYKPDQEALRAFAVALWDVGSREHQLVALFMLGRARLTTHERWHLGTTFLPDVDNWETCDQLCHHLLGEALARDSSYMDYLEGWIEHPKFWQRRAALVATVLLRRFKGAGDEAEALDKRALAMCEALLDDPEPYIAKAVDWAVREVIKRHPNIGAKWMFAQAEKDLPRKAISTLKKSAKKLRPEEEKRFLIIVEANARET